jgi:CheY-like chemotaxis protein
MKTQDVRTILWIEDDANIKHFLKKMLVDYFGSKNVHIASTINEAENKLACRLTFDCVILDIMLPKDISQKRKGLLVLDAGIEILKNIKKGMYKSVNPKTPIIVNSARTLPLETLEQLLDFPQDIVAFKPSSSRNLFNEIKNRVIK